MPAPYLANCGAGSGSGKTTPQTYPWLATGFQTEVVQLNAQTVDGTAIAQSKSNKTVLFGIATSPYVYAHSWDGASMGVKYANPSTLPGGAAKCVAFSPSGAACATGNGIGIGMDAYHFTEGTGFGARYSDPGGGYGGATTYGIAWHPSGSWVAIADNSGALHVWAWTDASGFGSAVSVAGLTAPTVGSGVAWSPDGRYLFISDTTTPYLHCYEFDPDAGAFQEKMSNPASLPAGAAQAVALNPAGSLVAVAHTTTPYFSVYPFASGSFGAKLTAPGATGLPAGNGKSIAFSPDGQSIAVGHTTTPFVTAYPIDVRTGIGAKLVNPTTAIGAQADGLLFLNYQPAGLSRPTVELQAQFTRRAFRKAVLALNPSSFWEMEEETGTSIKDHKRAVTGTTSGSPTLAQKSRLESDEGYSVYFDGTNDEVSFGDNYDLPGTGSYTLMFTWEQAVYPSASNWPIIGKFDAGVTNGWNVVIDSSGRLVTSRRAASASDTVTPSYGHGSGKHIGFVTYDGATISVYVDGVVPTNGTVASSKVLPGNAGNLYVGRNVGGSLFANGWMQAIAIWDGTALSAANILSLSNTWAAFGTDLLPYVDQYAALDIARGLGPDSKPTVGTLALDLNNESGIFTPDNTSSALYGLLRQYVPIRARMKDPVNGVWRPLWRGVIMDYDADFPRVAGRTQITCESRFGILSRVTPALTAYASVLTDAGVKAAGVAGGLRASADFDSETGVVTISQMLDYDTDTLSNMQAAAIGECTSIPNLWEGADGRAVMRASSTLASMAAVADYWAALSFSTPNLAQFTNLKEQLKLGERIARYQHTGYSNQVTSATAVIYTHPRNKNNTTPDSPGIPAGGVLEIYQKYTSPIQSHGAVTPVATTDFLGNTAANGTGTNKTSALAITFTDGASGFLARFSNSDAGTVYLTQFQVRGDDSVNKEPTIARYDPLFNSLEPSPNVTLESRPVGIGIGGVGSPQARYLCSSRVLLRRYPLPIVTVAFDWDCDEIQTSMLRAELGDLIRLTDKPAQFGSKLDDYYRIVSINHHIPVIDGPKSSNVTLRPAYSSIAPPCGAFDDFDRANISASLGVPKNEFVGWTTSAAFSIVSGKARADATGARVAYRQLGAGDAWGTSNWVTAPPTINVMAKLGLSNLLDAGSAFEAGIVYRMVDTSNYFRAVLVLASGAVSLLLKKRVAGSETTVTTVTGIPFEAAAELRVICEGTRHRVYLNGDASPLIDVKEDATLLTGQYVGIYNKDATAVDHGNFYAQGLN